MSEEKKRKSVDENAENSFDAFVACMQTVKAIACVAPRNFVGSSCGSPAVRVKAIACITELLTVLVKYS